MKLSAVFVCGLVLAGLTSCAGAIRDVLYQPPRAALSTVGLDAAKFSVRTADGIVLQGLYQQPAGDRPVILFFHGNASSAGGVMTWLKPVLDNGYGFVSAEYRGYSGNPGRPTQRGLAQDADAFFAFAKAAAGARPLYVVGHSLGGGVAFDLALRQKLDALVTIGAFASVRDAAPRIARAFVPDPYDNRAAVAKLDEPLFLVHGDKDAVVPPWHAAELQRAAVRAGNSGAAVALPGQGHQPDAKLVSAVLDAIGTTDNGARGAATTSAEVRILPFRP